MRDLTFKITADGTQAKRELKDVDQSITQVGTTAENTGKAIVAGLSGAAVLESVRRLNGLVKESVSSFLEADKAQSRLKAALGTLGAGDLLKPYLDVATSIQRITRASDETVQAIEADLLPIIGVKTPEQMQKAVLAVLDLSTRLGNVDAATNAVGKAMIGNFDTLSRYGIKIAETKDETTRFDDVIRALSERFGGQAAAELDTYSGKAENFRNRMDDLKESVGQFMLNALSPVIDLFLGLPEPLQIAGGAVVELAKAFGPGIAGGLGLTAVLNTSLVPTITGAVTGAWTGLLTFFSSTFVPYITGTLIPLFSTALVGAFEAILPYLGPIGWIAAGVIAVFTVWKNWEKIEPIVKGVYNAVKTWLVDKFRAVVDSIKGAVNGIVDIWNQAYDKLVGHSIIPDLVNTIGRWFDLLPDKTHPGTRAATSGITQMFGGMVSDVMGFLGGFASQFLPSWANQVISIVNQVIGAVSGVLKIIGALGGPAISIPGIGGAIAGGAGGGGAAAGGAAAAGGGGFSLGGFLSAGGLGLGLGAGALAFALMHLPESNVDWDLIAGRNRMTADEFKDTRLAEDPKNAWMFSDPDYAPRATVINNNITVEGSVVSERELINTVDAGLADKYRDRRPLGLG